MLLQKIRRLAPKWSILGLNIFRMFPWYFSYKGRVSAKKLQDFKNLHLNKRCFIIGNGPSLNKMNLHLLRDSYTFGLNRIYLLFPKLGFTTTYLVSMNRLVIKQCVEDILSLPIPKFLPWKMKFMLPFRQDLMFVPSVSYPYFCTDPARFGIWEGATVTYVALQLAYYMGFQEVILIGVDHNFETKGTPHQVITLAGDDPNHFSGDYFGQGFRWQLPDLQASEIAYHLAKETYEKDGRRIVDATVEGKLQIFPKINYNNLFH